MTEEKVQEHLNKARASFQVTWTQDLAVALCAMALDSFYYKAVAHRESQKVSLLEQEILQRRREIDRLEQELVTFKPTLWQRFLAWWSNK